MQWFIDMSRDMSIRNKLMTGFGAIILLIGINAYMNHSGLNRLNETADEGATIVQSVEGAMDKIDQSSKQISDIIELIDDIAFQTNRRADCRESHRC